MDMVSYEIMVLIAFCAIGLGIFLLVKGGSYTVDSTSWIADSWKVSKLYIAASVLALGTSAPELFISVNANLSEYPKLAIGNVVGSNIANILFVLGITSVFATIPIDRKKVRNDTIMMVAATVILAIGMMATEFDRLAGLLMLLMLVFYLVHQFRNDCMGEQAMGDIAQFDSKSSAFFTLMLGFAAMLLGSELLVFGAVEAGRLLGVGEAVIGITIVAFGTSLPELATCIAAARKRYTDMIIGGIIGSNIFNILLIVGLTALVKPLTVNVEFLHFDVFFVSAVTAALALILLLMNRIPKPVGMLFFIGYIWFTFMQYGDKFLE